MPKRKTPYRSKVKIGVDAEGKDIVKYIQGYTRAELDQARQAVIARYITGEAPEPDRLFGDYASEWFRVRKEPFISASSRESYRTALNKHLFPVLGNRMLRAITPLELQELLNTYAGKSKSMITSILATLRGVYGAALADRIVTRDPTERLVRPTAKPTAVKPALTADQRAALAAACTTETMGHYLALLYYLGCRPGEARGLMWVDVDWDRDLIHIARDIDYKASGQPGALKNAASNRHVPMPAPLRAILQPLRGLPDTYIAHAPGGADRPLSKSSADRLWVNLMAAAGLATAAPDDGKFEKYDPRHKLRPLITPHALRHNYITMCWEHGLDPYETMKLVGHASIATTMNIYTHLSEAQMAKTAAKLDDMFASPRVASKLHRHT
jgi:integrase